MCESLANMWQQIETLYPPTLAYLGCATYLPTYPYCINESSIDMWHLG